MERHRLGFWLVGTIFAALIGVTPSRAVTFSPFGDFGEGGSGLGQTFTIGSAGEVYWIQAFLDVDGDMQFLNQDLLDAYTLGFAFSNLLTPDGTNLFLHYAITNMGSAATPPLWFYTWLDVDLGTDSENDIASAAGYLGMDVSDPDPDGYEIADVYEFEIGKIRGDRLSGTAADVVLSLGFDLGVLAPGATVGVNLLLSENGGLIGSLALLQQDTETAHETVLTYSGRLGAPIPEPATVTTVALGLLLPAFRRWGKAVRNRTLLWKARGKGVA